VEEELIEQFINQASISANLGLQRFISWISLALLAALAFWVSAAIFASRAALLAADALT
jgi:hypothetical protein